MKANTQASMQTYMQEPSFTKKKVTLLTIVLWLHITILDLFVVTTKGPKMLWQDNIKLETLLTHAFLVAISVLIFVSVHHAYTIKNNKSLTK